ncbi:MAG: hypothetical protein WKG00_15425 [Polyangiaceae bacterium]
MRKVVLRGDVLLEGDQETLVSSSEDPYTHRRYQLSVKATPLR